MALFSDLGASVGANAYEAAQQEQQRKHLQYIISSGQDWGGQAAAQLNGLSQGNLSIFPSQPSAPQTAPPQSNSGFTTIGSQYDAEVAARNAGVDYNIGRGGGGSQTNAAVMMAGGGGAGAQTPSGTGQGGISGAGGIPNNSTPTSASPPNFSAGIQYPNSPPVQYAAPQNPAQQSQGGVLQMQQQSPQAGLNDYFNTAGYQLLNGPGAAQRFQASPGYQYAVDEALGQVKRNASARGLLESGSVMRDMTDRAQNMANQEYNNWWNRQNQQYGDYQNRLAGLAGGSTGADQANQLGMNLGAGSAQMSSNMGSLFGNMGMAGLSGITNTGAAYANQINQAGNQQAQINSANQATQLAGAISGQPQRTGLF